MATIGRVVVDVDANTAKFVKKLNNSARTMGKFGQQMRRVGRRAARAFVVGITAAVAAVTALSARGLLLSDQLAKTSQKLGIAADQLVGLRLAAEQTGVPIRQFDLGLQRMTRRLAEAAQGMGEAQGALKELGLDAQKLNRLSPDEQFRRIADAFQQISNQSDRVRLGFKLFDSEGVALINTLALGRKELDRFTDEAERLGLNLKSVQLENIERAADAQNLAGKAFTGLGRQLAATFAPAMERASKATADFVSRITQSIPKLAGFASAVLGISREVENLTRTEVRAELEQVFAAITRTQSKLIETQKALRALAQGGGGSTDSERQLFRSFQKAAREAAEDLARLIVRSQQLQAQFPRLSQEADAAARSFTAGIKKSTEAALELFEKTSEELKEIVVEMGRLESIASQIFNATRTPVENFVISMKKAREALRAGLIDEETFERWRQQWLENVIGPIDQFEKNGKRAFDEIEEAAKQAARNIQDAFAEFLFDPFDKGVKGMVKSFINAIRRMVANELAIKFFGFLKKIFKKPAPKGGGGKLFGFAHGGSFKVPGAGGTDSQAVAFSATPGERVTVTRPGQSIGGDITLTQINNFENAGGLDIETLIPIMIENNRKLKAELLDDFDRKAFA